MTERGEQEIFAFDPPDRPEGDDAQAFTLVIQEESHLSSQRKFIGPSQSIDIILSYSYQFQGHISHH